MILDLAELPRESTNIEANNKKKDKKEKDEDKEKEDSGEGKHTSVLQAKLTKVTIQISYFGMQLNLHFNKSNHVL